MTNNYKNIMIIIVIVTIVIAILTGAGQMAGSLVKGWLSKGVLKPSQVIMDFNIISINSKSARKQNPFITKVLASVPVQDSALLEPLTSLGCAGDRH